MPDFLFFFSNVYTHFFQGHRDPPFFESMGCHGNGAQVGRGELVGTLCLPRQAGDIKRRGGPCEEAREGRVIKKRASKPQACEGRSEPEGGSAQARKRASDHVGV